MAVIGVFGWFASSSAGCRRGCGTLGSYCLRYAQQTVGYAYFTLTDRYPSF